MRSIVLLVILAIPTNGTPTSHTVLYDRTIFPPSWHIIARASSHQRMHFSIAVKQQNLKQLESMFWAVSDPKSPQWQEFMSKDDIGALTASKSEDMTVVSKWLEDHLTHGDSRVEKGTDVIEVWASVHDTERLFNTEINVFSHDNGHVILRAMGEYSVPTEVAAAIDFVEGISEFPMHRSSAHKKNLSVTISVPLSRW